MARVTTKSLQARITELEAQLAATPVTIDPARLHIADDPRPENDHAAPSDDLAMYAALHCGVGHLPRKAQGEVITYFTKHNGERWMRVRNGNRSVLRPCA